MPGRRQPLLSLPRFSPVSWISGGAADIDTLPWARLRFSHTTAIRAALAQAVSEGRYAPATANKHLAALRGR